MSSWPSRIDRNPPPDQRLVIGQQYPDHGTPPGTGSASAFVKPYLVTHGGIPDNPPGGFLIFENIALVFMLVGLICMGIAVIRARVFPRWVGALFIVSPFVAFLGLPGPLAELSDYLAFIALATIGLRAVRSEAQHPAPAPGLAQAVPTA